MKIYARQIYPAMQSIYPSISDVYGVNNFAVYPESTNMENPEFINDIMYVFQKGDLAQDIYNIEAGLPYPLATAIFDHLPPENRSNYIEEEVKRLKDLVISYSECRRPEYLGNDSVPSDIAIQCEAISIVTGREWKVRKIYGREKDGVAYLFYVGSEWTESMIARFTIDYFNIGTQWVITKCEKEPSEIDKISGGILYCYASSDEETKKEIATTFNANPEDVVLFKFSGYKKIAVYEKV